MQSSTIHKVTCSTPQIIILLAEDSPRMREPADQGNSKADLANACLEDMILTTQAANLGFRGFIHLLSIARYGDSVIPLAEAQVPDEIELAVLTSNAEPGPPNFDLALDWAAHALELSLGKCRSVPLYDEGNSPPPLVALLCDPAALGPDLSARLARLRDFPFQGGAVNIVTCAIGTVSSPPGDAPFSPAASPDTLNVAPSQLPECLAPVAGEGCFSSSPST
jgi:hypothetical protein